jgi:thiol-disulfide isomerase/thioredoxin
VIPVRTWWCVALVAALLAACSGDAEPPVVDAVAEAAPTPPPRDAHLAEGGWPEAAAYIAREAAAGRPTVVNIFAAWCGPCRQEAPVLRAAMADHPDVAFLGIDHVDHREDGAAFLAEERLAFDATLFDVAGDVALNVRSRGMPTTAFFDHEGRLVHTHTGILTEGALAERLAELEAAARDG